MNAIKYCDRFNGLVSTFLLLYTEAITACTGNTPRNPANKVHSVLVEHFWKEDKKAFGTTRKHQNLQWLSSQSNRTTIASH